MIGQGNIPTAVSSPLAASAEVSASCPSKAVNASQVLQWAPAKFTEFEWEINGNPLRRVSSRAGRKFSCDWGKLARVAALVAPLAAFYSPAFAETRDVSGSKITLRPTERPGAEAEIEFQNNATNGPQDNNSFTLTLNGLEVVVTFEWNTGGSQNDRITVEPPEGYVAVPRTLDVMEFNTGTIYLFAAGPSS